MKKIVQFLEGLPEYLDISESVYHTADDKKIKLSQTETELLEKMTSEPGKVWKSFQLTHIKDEIAAQQHIDEVIKEIETKISSVKSLIRKESESEYVYLGPSVKEIDDSRNIDKNSDGLFISFLSTGNSEQDHFENSIEVYEGNEPYIFVSYAHADKEEILPVLSLLTRAGYRIWYDKGIEWGTEWSEVIGEHVEKCSFFLIFLSENSIHSKYCRKEINFADDMKKTILQIFLSPAELTTGLKLQLSGYQAIRKAENESSEELASRIMTKKNLFSCRKSTNDEKLSDSLLSTRKIQEAAAPIRKGERTAAVAESEPQVENQSKSTGKSQAKNQSESTSQSQDKSKPKSEIQSKTESNPSVENKLNFVNKPKAETRSKSKTQETDTDILSFLLLHHSSVFPVIILSCFLGAISGFFILKNITAVEWITDDILGASVGLCVTTLLIFSLIDRILYDPKTPTKPGRWISLLPFFLSILLSFGSEILLGLETCVIFFFFIGIAIYVWGKDNEEK